MISAMPWPTPMHMVASAYLPLPNDNSSAAVPEIRRVLLREQIEDIAAWVDRYQMPVTIASVAVVVLGIALQIRRGSGELVGLAHMGEDLDED